MAIDPLEKYLGKGYYNKGMNQARSFGTRIGTLKRLDEERKEEEKKRKKEEAELERAAKKAAKEEREKKKKSEEKKKGQSSIAKQNENSKARLKDAGIDPEDKPNFLQKALNLDADQGFFSGTLDLLNRPGDAITNVLSDHAKQSQWQNKQIKAQEKAKGRELTNKEKAKIFNKAGELKGTEGVLSNIAKGLSGEKESSFSDVLKAHGMKKGIARGVLGFAGDVALDPLNFAGGALGKGLTKGAELTGKGLDKIPGVDKVKEGIGSIFDRKVAQRKTLTGGKSEWLVDKARDVENERLYMQEMTKFGVAKSMVEGGDDAGRKISRELERPLNKIPERDLTTAPNVISRRALAEDAIGKIGEAKDAMKMNPLSPISRGLETAFDTKTTFKTGDVELPPSDKVRSWLQENGFDVNEKGRLSGFNKLAYKQENRGQLAAQHDVKAEIHRIVTRTDIPEAKKISMLKKNPAVTKATETILATNKAIRDYAKRNKVPLPEIDGYMAHFLTKMGRNAKELEDGGVAISTGRSAVGGNAKSVKRTIHESVKNINKKKGFEFFEPDAYIATAAGAQKFNNFIAAETMKKAVLGNKDFAQELSDTQKAGKGLIEMAIDGKRYAMTPGARDAIRNFSRNVDDEGINTFVKGVDWLQNKWKQLALFTGGFHSGNAIGNSYNMNLYGMPAKDVVTYSGKAMDQIHNATKALVGKGNVDKKVAERYDQFLRQGLKGTGSTADFAKDPAKAIMKDTTYHTKSTLGKVFHDKNPFNTSQRFGDAADEVSRFALFNYAIEKQGKSPKEAAKIVREVLFDYTDITETERQIFKRVAPFYTFMRKNAEFQVKASIKNPKVLSRLESMLDNAYANSDLDEEGTPKWMKENMSVPIPGMNRTANLALPAQTLSDMMDNPGKMLLNSISPLAKVPIELGTNTSWFDGRKIDTGEKASIFGAEVSQSTKHAFEGLSGFMRNTNKAVEARADGKTNQVDNILTATGLSRYAKPYDKDKLQLQVDYEEKDRLDRLKAEAKSKGVKLRGIRDIRKSGTAVTDDDKAKKEQKKELVKLGNSKKDAAMLMKLKEDVYNDGVENAVRVAEALRGAGYDEDTIEFVTKDYLEY